MAAIRKTTTISSSIHVGEKLGIGGIIWGGLFAWTGFSLTGEIVNHYKFNGSLEWYTVDPF